MNADCLCCALWQVTRTDVIIAIKRPLDELEILITFEKLAVNLPLPSDKFELTIPAGTTIYKLD